jgi:lysine 2,3-aminomutase
VLAILPQEPDWRAQLRAAVRSPEALAQVLDLDDDERRGLALLAAHGGLPLGITPHFLSLIDRGDPADPLRRQVVPRASEYERGDWDRRDPLGEEDHEVVPFLVHRYPDRVLLLATDRCAAYCRFCTRKRMVGQGPTPTKDDLAPALDYVAAHPAIREVIVSGGDALMLSDERLGELLARVRAIPHVEIIRLATRMLAFAPSRVTDALLATIRPHHPVYVLAHFNHPREVGDAAAAAIGKLVDAGVPVLNQTVLLRGVNDDAETLATLFRALTRLRARPYYLHQCDLTPGTDAFRVPLERALELVGALRGRVSGLSVPTFVVDIPGGFGKVPLHPDPIVGGDETHVALRGFDGEVARYPRG